MQTLDYIKNYKKILYTISKTLYLLVVFLTISYPTPAQPKPDEIKPLNFGVTTGTWAFENKTIDITGKLIHSYGYMHGGGGRYTFVTFNTSGWNYFRAYVGVVDPYFSGQGELIIKVDGEERKRISTGFKQKPQEIKIYLTGSQTMTFEHPSINSRDIIIGEPTICKGTCESFKPTANNSTPPPKRNETSPPNTNNQDNIQEILKQLRILNQNIENLNKKIDELKINRAR